jgi:hypothetical protein
MSPGYDVGPQAPLAQLAEQRTLNPQVEGSIPSGRTKDQVKGRTIWGNGSACVSRALSIPCGCARKGHDVGTDKFSKCSCDEGIPVFGGVLIAQSGIC